MTNTVFPGALDTFVNPVAGDKMNGSGPGGAATIHHLQHAKPNDAIAAVQVKVGIDGSADTNSIDYKLTHLASTVTTQGTSIASLSSDFTSLDSDVTSLTSTVSSLSSTVSLMSSKLLPAGGSTGQVLTKNSGTSYDASWAPPAGGGGGGDFFGTASGTNTYTVTTGATALASGDLYVIVFTNGNSAAATLNPDSLGATAIQRDGVALIGGEIPAGAAVELVYDGTHFQLLDFRGLRTKATTLTATGGESSITLPSAPIGDLLIYSNGTLLPPPYTSVGLVYDIPSATSGDKVTVVQLVASNVANPTFGTTVAEAVSAWSKLAAWYELTETSGTTLHDAHTGGFNLTVNGSPTLNQTAIRGGGGKSVFFGSNAYAINSTGPDLYAATTGHAVTAWIKPNASPANSSGIAVVVVCWNSSSNDTPYWLTLDASNKLTANFTHGGTNQFDTDGGSALASGTGYFVGYSADMGSKEITFYQNGAVSSGPTGFANVQSGGSDKRIMIGALDAFANTYFANSWLQGIAVWSEPLSDAEHAYLYNSGNGQSYAQFKIDAGH